MIQDFKLYKMKLKILSPTFIGSGEEYDRCDYIYDGQYINIIEQNKWIEYQIEESLLDEFTDKLNRNGKNLEIDKWLRSKNKDLKKVIKRCCVKKFKIANMTDFKSNTIHSFVKNIEGKPYIPGSSIKGAIVSAFIGYYAREKNLDYRQIKNMKIKGISVSDSTSFDLENLELYKKKDRIIINGEEKQNELPIYRECAIPGTVVEFTIRIDEKLVRESGINNFKGLDSIYDSLCNKFKVLYDEKIGIINNYDTILDYMPGEVYKDGKLENGILILGGGAGFHSKSIVSSLYDDFNDAFDETQEIFKKGIARKHHHENDDTICPRAIKLADVGKMVYMGFCKIYKVEK